MRLPPPISMHNQRNIALACHRPVRLRDSIICVKGRPIARADGKLLIENRSKVISGVFIDRVRDRKEAMI